LLVFLWGVIALVTVPWEPFGVANVAQILVCGPLLGYLVRTWNRPRGRIAEGVIALMIAYTLLRLPWAAVEWARLGRPVEAFTVPQLAAIAIGLFYPGRWWHAAVAICLFSAESVFAFLYARHLGIHELIPLTEPFATFASTTLGFGLLIMRERSRRLAQLHVSARAEIEALERVRPQLVRAREELETQGNILADEIRSRVNRKDPHAHVIGRALDRLGDLRHKLGDLVTIEEPPPSLQEAERRLLEHDAQLGATLLAGLGVFFAIPAINTFHTEVRGESVPWFVALFAFYAVMLGYLIITRRRPSSRRAVWVVLALYAATLPLITYNQFWLLQVGRPYAPFLGHKLLMGILGLTLTTRFWLGVVLIVIAAANAVVIWFVLDLGAYDHILESAEPVVVLLYMLVGIVALRLLERRQNASIQLLRDEAAASAMHRRTVMFLALRDRLNSPLQTLVLGAPAAISQVPTRAGERMQAAIDRLVDLSHELADLEVPVSRRLGRESFDAEHELRRRI
jgi:hypothetical protein